MTEPVAVLGDATDRAVTDIRGDGYHVADDCIDGAIIAGLAASALGRHAGGQTTKAGVGKARVQSESVRGDSIVWLDRSDSDPAVRSFFALVEELRQAFNQQLFLNVHDFEGHFAVYAPGATYEKHVDRFSTGDQRRTVSLVLYLNHAWEIEHGGALRLYPDADHEPHVDIAPVGGRLVLFESARFWHEVLPATRERVSIAGWFRTR